MGGLGHPQRPAAALLFLLGFALTAAAQTADFSDVNHEFWPEMFTPLSLLPITGRPLYGDSPAPHKRTDP